MERLIRDVRYAVRRMLGSPGFTAVAVISLALGIGANTAIFTMVTDILFRDLPYEDPGALVELYPSDGGRVGLNSLSYPELEDLRDGTSEVFRGVAATSFTLVQENVEGGSETLATEVVTGNWFGILGLEPVVGRFFVPDEDRTPGTRPVVVLSHRYWQRRFAGDPGAVGRTLRLNGKPYTVVGVAPPDLPSLIPGIRPEIFAPVMMTTHLNGSTTDLLESRGTHNMFAKARLRDGVTPAQAQTVVDRVVRAIHAENADYYPDDWGVRVWPTTEVAIHPLFDRVLFPAAGVLLAVVAMVLLIACVNLASFLLARALDRRKEVALRMALGAGRGALVRQLLTETVLLALVGGALGVGLAILGLRALAAVELPAPVPIDFGLSPDWTVLLFSLLISIGAGLLFGLLPALQTTNPDVAPTLKNEAVRGGTRRRLTLRNGLVVAQVAVSLLLLVGSGLFLRSLQAAGSVDPGFGREPTGIAWLGLSPERYDGPEATRFWEELVNEVEALPGVRAAGAVDLLALQGTSFTSREINVPGVDPPEGQAGHRVDAVAIDGGYFDAAGVRLRSGRSFGPEDGPDAPRTMIVSQAFVDRFFPGREPLGQTVYGGGGEVEYQVVGVAEDTNVRALGEAPIPYMYFPLTRSSRHQVLVLARTADDPAATARRIVEMARDRDPEIMVIQTKTMEEHLGFQLFPFQLGGLLLGVFGALALLLATIGLYGVVSYAAASRTREVGIRISLGARAGEVVKMVMKGGMALVLAGTVPGLALAFLASRLLESLLFGVEPSDPVTFVGVTALLLGVAAAATLVPAVRASRVDPVKALRRE